MQVFTEVSKLFILVILNVIKSAVVSTLSSVRRKCKEYSSGTVIEETWALYYTTQGIKKVGHPKTKKVLCKSVSRQSYVNI